MKKDFQFIIPEKAPFDKDKKAPASYIRKSFTIKAPVKKAVLEMTALGVYKLFVNGVEADKRMLLPGFTNYRKRLQYQTFDITNRTRRIYSNWLSWTSCDFANGRVLG